MSIRGRSFFCSWSGGKDSCLALHRAVRDGGRPRFLLTMVREGTDRTMSHGLPVELVRKQARALGVEPVLRAATWNTYEAEFLSALRDLKREGVEAGVFGDIDIDEHRGWVERVCGAAGIEAHEPLWQGARRDLIEEFLRSGFLATIVVVREGAIDAALLGRTLDRGAVAEIERGGADASGERGEYHTVVTDGPVFSEPIRLETGAVSLREGCRCLDVRAV